MIATNSVAPISGSLRAEIQKLRADALTKQEFESLDPDVVGSLIDILDQAERVLAVLADEEECIQADATLSDLGKVKEMTKVVQEAHDKLRVIERKATERRQAHESESVVIYSTPKSTGDPIANAIREYEIRQRFQSAPVWKAQRAYMEASDNGWSSTMRALKDVEVFGENPALTSYVQRVDQERFEEKEPRRWARLNALKYSAEVLQALALGIDFRLSGYAEIPSFQGNPTGHMDLGLANSQESLKKSMVVDKPLKTTPAFV